MKKALAIVCSMFAAGSLCAGNIYDVKISGKTPTIKKTQSTYYKAFGADKIRGYVNVEYLDDGQIDSPCDAIFYGNFNGVNTVVETTVDVTIANIYGKDLKDIEMYFTCELENMDLVFAGLGKIKKEKTTPDLCGDDTTCNTIISVDKVTGNYVGIIDDVLCDPCGDARTWEFNECLENAIQPGEHDVTFGSWSFKHNKKLSKECFEVGFPECVEGKIPAKFKDN